METNETWKDLLSLPYVQSQRQRSIRASKGNGYISNPIKINTTSLFFGCISKTKYF